VGGIQSGETWFWNGTDWTQGPGGPSARAYHAMAYDQTRHEHVLFGGNSQGVELADTWIINGATWTHRIITGPPARSGHAMVFDSHRQRVVLFGGLADHVPSYFADTWEWDGTNWTQALVQGPSGRRGHLMTYDPRRRRVVLIGGETFNQAMTDTWEYDGSAWIQRAPYPAAVAYGATTFDPLAQRIVVFGGSTGVIAPSMWDYDGIAWRERVSDTGFARSLTDMVFDTTRSCFVLFGGRSRASTDHGDTLEMPAGNNPISITTQPADQAIHNGDTAVFTTSAAGSGPFTYQWWHTDASGVVEGPGGAAGGQFSGGFVAGATTPTLTITRASPADMYQGGRYFCRISNPCTSISTRAAILTVTSCGTADFDHDGSPGTDADIQAFFACLAGNCCPTCGSPDFNADGDYATDNDIEAFFRVLAGGTC
jgi:hypothetical protein